MAYRIRSDIPMAKWMMPENKWYHGNVTFNTEAQFAKEFDTEQEAQTFIDTPRPYMPPDAHVEEIS